MRRRSDVSAENLRAPLSTVALDATDLTALVALARAATPDAAFRQAARVRSLLGSAAAALEPLLDALQARSREAERLKHLAGTDALTGIANRRSFSEALRRELARAERSRQPLSLLVIDVDGLKKINDGKGHAAGDAALRMVGHCMRASMRQGDLAARIGGDEFAALLPATSGTAAYAVGERIRAQVAHGSHGTVGISVGVALSAGCEYGPTALLRAADEAMYRDKQRRRRGSERLMPAFTPRRRAAVQRSRSRPFPVP